MTRPITDSFALVKVGDIQGAKVYYSNSEVAVTNAKGEAMVPSLISYIDNKLSFEATDVPVNYELMETEKYVSPPYRSGSVVSFDVRKIQAFEGQLLIVVKGQKKPAESAMLEVKVEGKVIDTVVGKRGDFFLENLKPGKFPAKLTIDGRECNFEMVVPESSEMTVNMGEISCEMD
jgi:outer membrane usher protein